MDATTTVGIAANPASARDIRRLVAHGGAVTTHDKVNRLRCVLAGLATAGVERVISMSDRSGIASGLIDLATRPSARNWPKLELVDQAITGTPVDTTIATQAMVAAGVGSIVVLGGDGTNRIVADAADGTPLVSLSTGTNNAFPQPTEPTVAGLAAGLVATDMGCRQAGTYQAKQLVVSHRERIENALVDVAISDVNHVGSGAVWDPSTVSELYLSFAEPDAIGLSAIGGHARPTSRRSPTGLALMLGQPSVMTVHPPISPGLLASVPIRSLAELRLDTPQVVTAESGVVAVDGERLFRFGPPDRPIVTLRSDGPIVVDVGATLSHAAASGLLSRCPEAN